MNDLPSKGSRDSDSAIEISPSRTLLQAIYHDVTGKTENLSKSLSRNVLIKNSNIYILHEMLTQQVAHYDVVAGPTVTVVVKQSNNRSIQYSSWERFDNIRISSNDITSELIIKYEFIVRLAGAGKDQRCIINISMDSGLPVISDIQENSRQRFFGMMFFSDNYNTVDISIDFVDFLLAKIFCGVVEEWFNDLEPVPKTNLTRYLVKNIGTFHQTLRQFDKIGMAAFLFGYVYFNDGILGNPARFVYSIALSLVIWATFSIVISSLSDNVSATLSNNNLPSIILMTEADEKVYNSILNKKRSVIIMCIKVALTVISGVLLNIASSFIFNYIVK